MSPVDIDAPGWPPSWLSPDIKAQKSYRQIVSEVLVHLDGMVAANRRVMRTNAWWTRLAIFLLMVTPALGALAAIGVQVSRLSV